MESNEDISFNILNLRSSSIKNSLLGKRRACSSITRYEWTFLILVILTLAIVLGVILFRLSYLSTASSDFALAIILLINILFCYAYSCHGVLFEQPYEILLLVISTVIILVYTILSYHIGDVHDTIKTAKFVYTSFVGPIIIVTGIQIGCNYRQSGNLIFRTVGGDPFMQSICRKAQLQCVLLLFDMQAIFNCLVLIIRAANVSSLQETVVLAMGSVFTIGWTILGYITVRLESIACLGMFLVLGTVQPSYIVWQFVNAGLFQTDSLVLWSVSVSGGFFLVLRMYLIVNTLCVYKNFGKGLREKIYGTRRSNSRYGTFGEAAHS